MTRTRIGDNAQSLAAQMLAYAESLCLAERDDVDPKLAIGVMASSAIGSAMPKSRRSRSMS